MMGRWLGRIVVAAGLVLGTIILGRAFQARTLPDLKPWHRTVLARELKASEMTASFTLADYLRREEEVFREMNDTVISRLAPADRTAGNRYFTGSPMNPVRFSRNWNRTFELVPERIVGGALLVHGLTDGPYSVRPVAELLKAKGHYALGLRMPGHGTVPGALTRADWEDWRAAVRVGARHVRRRIGDGKPLVLVGYSNGGALLTQYALDVAGGEALPKADRVVLLSPMIGVTPFALFSKIASVLAGIPYFEKSRWLDVLPEYNPYKYNSFPTHAAEQTFELTRALSRQIHALEKEGRLSALPPILTFQSLVDATVLTPAIVDRLYAALPANGSELVLYDLNRAALLDPFLKPEGHALLADLASRRDRRYRLTIVTNASPETREVVARTMEAGSGDTRERPLGLSWPGEVYSLSHVAIPFPVTDPLYGSQPDRNEDYGVRLGLLAPRGERSVLNVPVGDFLRISYNPFYPHLAERVAEWVGR